MQLALEQLTKSFGEKQVLKGISLQANSGRALGLLGRNGAGKTTTIRIVMDVFPPDGGRVLLDGTPLRDTKVRVGYLPEERGMYPKKKILEQLVYFGCLRGMKSGDAKRSALEKLERLGMAEYAGKKLETLSKGNQQKIQLAATLVCNPEIVILDEPFSGLDPVNAMLLKDVVHELIQAGKIVLFSSHQMNYIEEFCDDIAILNGGAIVLSGDLRDIKRSFDRRRILLDSADAAGICAFVKERCAALVEQASLTEKGQADIRLKKEEDKTQLLQALAGQSFDVDAFRVYEPSLNDIFVTYTEGGI
ncbi:MAG TPA: ATP-binding cassette domain-containing protein [Candidatus Gallacutalibacter stercoravium]|nr:ATP-binding cassette domain-containing protein [Candidatus Gallacutalibacter stercoravium]